MQQELLTISKVAQLAGCSEGTVRKDADSGRLPIAVRTAAGERLPGIIDGVLYATNRRFGLSLKTVDAASAAAVAAAIKKSTAALVAEAYPAIVGFASLVDPAGQSAITKALISVTPRAFNPFAHRDVTSNVDDVQKLVGRGNVKK